MKRENLLLSAILIGLILFITINAKTQELETLTLVGSIQTIAIDEIDQFTGKLKGRLVHYLRSEDGESYEVEDPHGRLLTIKPGRKVILKGTGRDNKIRLTEVSPFHSQEESTLETEGKLQGSLSDTTGAQRTLVALFNYPDVSNQPFTLQEVRDVLINDEDSADQFVRQNSYGKTWLEADFVDWHTLPNPSNSYTSLIKLQDDAIQTVDPLVDFRNYGRLIFIYLKNPFFQNIGGAGTVGKWSLSSPRNGPFTASITYLPGPTGPAGAVVIAHELGHNFGFGHASTIYMIPKSLFDPTYSGGAWDPAGDLDDTMGGMTDKVIFGHFSSIWKTEAQWIETSQIQDVSHTGEYVLDQVELPSAGMKVLRIPLGKNNRGEDFYYWIEYRRNLGGFDKEDSIQIRTRPDPFYTGNSWYPGPIRFKRFSTSGGAISGRVTAEANGAGIRDAKLWLGDDTSLLAEVWTDRSGDYRISGVPAGSYYLTVFAFGEGFYQAAYRDLRDKIRVFQGREIPNANFSLELDGAITGRVTRESDGSGMANVKIHVLGGGYGRETVTDPTGYYRMGNLLAGCSSCPYIVWTENNQGFIDEYYNGATNEKDAAPVYIPTAAEISNINFSLASRGSASIQPQKGEEPSGTKGTAAPAFDNIDINRPFHDPYRGVKVEVVDETGTASESKVRLLVTLSGLSLNPEGILYAGTPAVGETSLSVVSVTNNSNSSVTIGTLFLDGKDQNLFHISNDNCSNRSLSAGGGCAATLAFSPTSFGDKHAVVVVPNSDGIRPNATLSLYGFVSAPAVELISNPSIPGGPEHGTVGMIYHYATGGSTSNAGDWIEYLFDWGDGTNSGWLPVGQTAWKAWALPGIYKVKAQARCFFHTSVVSSWSEEFSVNIRDASAETVSLPNIPSGLGIVKADLGTNYPYSTRGSVSSLGHPVQYLLDWGDGTDSGWLPVGEEYSSKTWSVPGFYHIRAKARCALDPSVESYWALWSPIIISLIGPDLTGGWTSLQQTKNGSKWKITGTLTIENIGNRDTSPATVTLYLSNDPVLDEGDTFLKSSSTGKIKAWATKSQKVNLASGSSASGKYLIAVIDSSQSVQEVDETNNIIVYGPIP